MLPMQRKKVDISSLTPEEKKLFELYGKLPAKKNVLSRMQKERKYFDSGDYAMSKAGIQTPAAVGTAIPQPESIPHATPSPHPSSSTPTGATGGSPPNDTPLRQHSEILEAKEDKEKEVESKPEA